MKQAAIIPIRKSLRADTGRLSPTWHSIRYPFFEIFVVRLLYRSEEDLPSVPVERRTVRGCATSSIIKNVETLMPEVRVVVGRGAAVRKRLLLAGTGFPPRSPHADFGRQGHRAEGQLPGAASYSHCRP